MKDYQDIITIEFRTEKEWAIVRISHSGIRQRVGSLEYLRTDFPDGKHAWAWGMRESGDRNTIWTASQLLRIAHKLEELNTPRITGAELKALWKKNNP